MKKDIRPGARRAQSFRKALVKSVKIAQRDLGLDDETYRELLFNVTGEVTSTKCSAGQLQAMLGEMRRKGWRGRPKRQDEGAALRGKISAQCYALGAPLSYASAIIRRQTGGAATFRTATPAQLSACVAALTRAQERAAREAAN